MIKKIILFKIFTIILLFSIGADAALQWKVGALLGTFATGVSFGLGLLGAAPIVVAGTLAVGVHAAVIALYWDDINPPTPTSSSGFSVVIDANTPFTIPETWTPPIAINGVISKEPTPPIIQVPTDNYRLVYNQRYFDTFCGPNSVSEFYASISSPRILITACNEDANQIDFTSYDLNNQPVDTQTAWNVPAVETNFPTCPAGYKIDFFKTKCDLLDATLVQKPADTICEAEIKGGLITPSPIDPDCKNTTVIGLGTSTITAATPTKSVYIATAPNGTVTVYEKNYNLQSNTTTLSTANFNAQSDLDFIQTANSLGNNVLINPVSGGTGTSTGTGDAKDSSLNVKEGGDEAIGSATSKTGGATAPDNDIKTSLNPFKNWALPINLGQCPTATFEIFNKSIYMDSHCTIFNDNSNVIKQSMGVVFTITALFIILGA